MKIVIVREVPAVSADGAARRRASGRGWKVAAAVAVSLLFGVGLVSAAIPNSVTGQLTVCARTSGLAAGQMRLIDYQAGQRCGSGERTLSWQQNGMRYRGAWKSTVAYSPNDVVLRGGNAYVALAVSTNVAPTTASKWSVMASFVHPAQIVWVAKSGGDFTSLSAALASIKDASAAKPYVIRIAPGVYTETKSVQLKSYVDVQGSGQGVTKVTCACGTIYSPNMNGTGAVLRVVGHAVVDVRDLTVENRGGNTYSEGVWVGGSNTAGTSLTHLTVNVTPATNGGGYGVTVNSGQLVVDGLTVHVNDAEVVGATEVFALYEYQGFLAAHDTEARAQEAANNVGVMAVGGTVEIDGGLLVALGVGGLASVHASGTDVVVRHARLNGMISTFNDNGGATTLYFCTYGGSIGAGTFATTSVHG